MNWITDLITELRDRGRVADARARQAKRDASRASWEAHRRGEPGPVIFGPCCGPTEKQDLALLTAHEQELEAGG